MPNQGGTHEQHVKTGRQSHEVAAATSPKTASVPRRPVARAANPKPERARRLKD